MAKNTNTDTPSYPGSVPMVKIDGSKIRQLRESKKLTQLYISTVVGVTTDTISRWENRHYQSIKLENAEKLAQALEISFEEILKQNEIQEPESEPEVQDTQPKEKVIPPRKRLPVFFVVLSVVLLAFISGIILYSLFSGVPPTTVSATRILPPHVSPGQTFPVLIRVHSGEEKPVSLIIKEIIPQGTHAVQGLPPINSKDRKENSLKWIRRIETETSVYAYMCEVPLTISQKNQLNFHGSVTLKQNVRDRQDIDGPSSVAIAPYHWADSNRDYMIDDEEILAVYDTYSDIEALPIDRELIDSIWASTGYKWDKTTERFITVD